jgi:hypothetical protein
MEITAGRVALALAVGVMVSSSSARAQSVAVLPQPRTLVCFVETGLKSVRGDQATSIVFQNDTATPVQVYWLDYQGKRVPYRTLDTGKQLDQKTYATHPWVITDLRGNCLKIVVPGSSAATIALSSDPGYNSPVHVDDGDHAGIGILRKDAATLLHNVNPLLPSDAAVKNCAASSPVGSDAFTRCVVHAGLPADENRIYDCLSNTRDTVRLASCVAKGRVSEQQAQAIACAQSYSRSGDNMIGCAINTFLNDDQKVALKCAQQNGVSAATLSCVAEQQMNPDQKRVVECYRSANNKLETFGACVAARYVNIDPKVSRAIACATDRKDVSAVSLAFCMVAGDLTPEQQVVGSCAIETGGAPPAFAGCVGGKLTVAELNKCQNGIGTDNGCFGPNNTIRKYYATAWNDLTKGPGPNNEVRKILDNAQHDLTQGPGPNNELRKAAENAQHDLTKGPGPNNEIRKAGETVGKALQQLNPFQH